MTKLVADPSQGPAPTARPRTPALVRTSVAALALGLAGCGGGAGDAVPPQVPPQLPPTDMTAVPPQAPPPQAAPPQVVPPQAPPPPTPNNNSPSSPPNAR